MRATTILVALTIAMPAAASAQGRGQAQEGGRGQANMRFAGMDRNGDGVIARTEWRGSDRSFRVHDWNADGVLSGDEVRTAVRREGRALEQEEFGSPNQDYEFDDWTARGFTGLDHNRDNRIARDEWHFDQETFRRVDHNRDGALSRAEFLGTDTAEDDDRGDRFRDMDDNNDGRVTREEWHGAASRFAALDTNRDQVLSRAEVAGDVPPELFASIDVNRDGSIVREEWHWTRASFDARDANHDGRLSRAEFNGPSQPNTSAAYRGGYDRGMIEGRAAGREDRERNQGWDLDGQRELEGADSGYEAGMGAKADYQAGYREAFRIGYREGYGR